jgi:Subtilase family
MIKLYILFFISLYCSTTAIAQKVITKASITMPNGIIRYEGDIWKEDSLTIGFRGYDAKGKPIFTKADNNVDAASTLGTDQAYPGASLGLNLTGRGLYAGIWDGGGVLVTHQELRGRATQNDNPSTTNYHATHVAGTMVASGINPLAKGMSYQASLRCYDWNDDGIEMNAAARAGMLISNHSYGDVAGWSTSNNLYYWSGDTAISAQYDYKFGYYDDVSRDWDNIAQLFNC